VVRGIASSNKVFGKKNQARILPQDALDLNQNEPFGSMIDMQLRKTFYQFVSCDSFTEYCSLSIRQRRKA
jgi:hypothetical protein